ncbi:MAG: MogA/MoaB family molybdenum cofactor biosynthesis protein [Chloroflexota bacterium]
MYRVGILTISDKGSRGQRADKSSGAIRESLSPSESTVVDYAIVPDEREVISATLQEWADNHNLDVILTTGGTGLAPRDVTPEATLAVVEKAVPGLPEAMRLQNLAKTPLAMLSRAAAGVRGRCLIVNLPGSPKAVRENMEIILPVLAHAVGIIKEEITEHAAGGHGEGQGHAH